MPDFLSPTVLINFAGGCYVLGFLIINQVALRLMVLLGSLAYVGYYATVAASPLWGAINTTGVIILANLLGLVGLYLRNASFAVPRGYEDVYADFKPLLPGDFRKLMHLATRRVLDTETTVTREGASLDRIYFVIKGMPVVTKMGTSFPLAERVFVGEVAYLTGKGSAATTTLPAGAEVLEWDLNVLRRAAERKPQVKLALDAVISQDLARKVALAVAPAARQIAHDQAQLSQHA